MLDSQLCLSIDVHFFCASFCVSIVKNLSKNYTLIWSWQYWNTCQTSVLSAMWRMGIVRWRASISRYWCGGSAITIWQLSDGRWSRCVLVDARNATTDELRTAHDEEYIEKIQKSSSTDVRMWTSDHESPLYIKKGSYKSALLATGSVIEVRLFAITVGS